MSPVHLWEKLEEYLFDQMELKYTDVGKPVVSTIGEYVESLLARDKYFSTPLPRIPVKVRQMLEKELAPLHQYRKRMEANLRTFRTRRLGALPVEVRVDGDWIRGVALEYVGRASQRVRAQLEDGSTVQVHLGKVVLREESGDSDSRAKKRRRSHSLQNSPDWSRFKGRSDAEMVQELRDKAKEDAVCAGKSYARRPLTVEEELWKREPEVRVSLLGDERPNHRRPLEERRESEASRRMRYEEEEERMKRMRVIYEKYGSAKSSGSTTTAKVNDVDEPDVLRLG